MELAAGTILYLDGVSVSFDGFKALNDLSFIIAPGEKCAPSSDRMAPEKRR